MFSKLALVAAVATVASASLTIDTPASLIECQPTSLVWSGGSSSPYYLSVIPGGEVSSSALESLDSTDSSPYTWTVDIASGTNVTIKVTDGDGNIAYSSAVVIQSGSDSSCLTSTASSSSTSSSDSASTDSSDSTTTSGSSSSTSDSSDSTASSTTTSSSSSSTTSSSGAILTKGNAGVAATVVGVLAAAFAAVA